VNVAATELLGQLFTSDHTLILLMLSAVALTCRTRRNSIPESARSEKDMDSPLNVFKSGKLAGRVSRWRLAAALGAASLLSASAVASASPASAAVVTPAKPAVNTTTCVVYHSWQVCIGYDSFEGLVTINAESFVNAGVHALKLEVYMGNGIYWVYSQNFTFTANAWNSYSEDLTPNSGAKSWGDIDATRIVGVPL
jgi:hypothetical protein